MRLNSLRILSTNCSISLLTFLGCVLFNVGLWVSICLSLSVCLSVRLSVCLSICVSVYLCDFVPIYMSACLHFCMPVCLSDCVSVCLSVYHNLSRPCLSLLLPVCLCLSSDKTFFDCLSACVHHMSVFRIHQMKICLENTMSVQYMNVCS